MKKIIFPLYSKIALAVFAMLSIIGVIVDQILDKGTYLYIGSGFTIDTVRLLVAFVHIGLLTSAIIVFLFKNLKKKWLHVTATIVIVLISGLCFLWRALGILSFMPSAYVEIVSDDNEHHIVIAEDSYLFSPYGGDIYIKTSSFTMKKLGKYEADLDFYTPFSDGKYLVIWNEENFELFYDSDGDGKLDEKIWLEYVP